MSWYGGWPGRLRGVPMYSPAQECRVIVLIDEDRYETWRSRSGARAIYRAVRKKYPLAKLRFGVAIWRTL